MLNRLTPILLLPLLIAIGWTSWIGYRYFFDTTKPVVKIIGLEEGGYYSGEVQCIIEGSDNYQVKDIKLLLDSKPLPAGYHKINKKTFQYPITLSPLADGKHSLYIEVQDASYRANTTKQQVEFTIDNKPIQVFLTKDDLDYKVFQGRTLHIQFQVNKTIKEASLSALNGSYKCFQESPNSFIYECFVPIAWDTTATEYPFQISITDLADNGIQVESKFQVIAFPFKKQTLAVDPKKVALEKDLGLKQKAFEDEVAQLTLQSPPYKLWQGAFYPPMEIKKVTTEYGTLRITQDRGIRAHTALDVVNTPKSVVWACQDGIIVVKDRYALSGNTIVIDHGCGILSLYYHLDSFAEIEKGDKIKKGYPIGTEGMTGYANGFHLHWEMRVNNIPVDPIQWTKIDF